MLRTSIVAVSVLLVSLTTGGCIALLAGAAGGAGTAVWLSDKLSQEVNVPRERALKAVRAGLKSMKLSVSKETVAPEVTQVKSAYSDGRALWVDIRPLDKNRSRIDVRVGAVNGEEAARQVLDSILRRL